MGIINKLRCHSNTQIIFENNMRKYLNKSVNVHIKKSKYLNWCASLLAFIGYIQEEQKEQIRIRNIWRDQSDNQKPYVEGQKMHWHKEKGQKDSDLQNITEIEQHEPR